MGEVSTSAPGRDLRARRRPSATMASAMNLPRTADAVIIGGGVVGCSIAYHLAKRGVRDVARARARRGRRGHDEQGGGRHPRPVPHGDRDPVLARVHPRVRAIRGGVRRRSRLPEDRLPLPVSDAEDLRGFEQRVALQRRLGVDVRIMSPSGRAGAGAGAPRRRSDRGGLGSRGRHGRAGRGDGRLRAARARAGRAHRRGRRGARDHPRRRPRPWRRDVGGTVESRVVVNAAGPAAARVGRLAGVDLPGPSAATPHLLHRAVPRSARAPCRSPRIARAASTSGRRWSRCC